jgi:anaerobic ribonucleoside-triphosphate reductase
MLEFIRKRNNDIVSFDPSRIWNAINKAYLAHGVVDTGEIQIMVNAIVDQLMEIHATLSEDMFISVEQIQDVVEQILMKFEKFDIAKSYIVYRQERTKLRAEEADQEMRKVDSHDLFVRKYDGTTQRFDENKIKMLYQRIV